MTPDRSHSDLVAVCKVRVEGGEALFDPYFYIPKYRSSDALPAPEIFNLFSVFLVKIFNYIIPESKNTTGNNYFLIC